ncbi:Hypothetical Protein CGB_A5340C [Cryptococcus gattii WM276]|uniref:Uncharacterized protein n=2 Tax=Cryptococcus gattii TaxID=37769 RepID=E6QXX9_CRYGW|nr:Hypothetical Protein CGB_A5340C [Cryptococcus gattii WM276]ADV19741.1 Hypothetical Protein CGB_A5340C [Cryptococcus gattii WM276]KIR79692.1 hypothetical protein I306_03268 [Cryptococcus gattii EJB2]KJE02819.1 hypothetical protein I311_03563 [Cryptococcus gattii NT-10]
MAEQESLPPAPPPPPLAPPRYVPAYSDDQVMYQERYVALQRLIHELEDENNLIAYRALKEERRLGESGTDFRGFAPEEGDVNGWFNNSSGRASRSGPVGDESAIESRINDSISEKIKLDDDDRAEIQRKERGRIEAERRELERLQAIERKRRLAQEEEEREYLGTGGRPSPVSATASIPVEGSSDMQAAGTVDEDLELDRRRWLEFERELENRGEAPKHKPSEPLDVQTEQIGARPPDVARRHPSPGAPEGEVRRSWAKEREGYPERHEKRRREEDRGTVGAGVKRRRGSAMDDDVEPPFPRHSQQSPPMRTPPPILDSPRPNQESPFSTRPAVHLSSVSLRHPVSPTTSLQEGRRRPLGANQGHNLSPGQGERE